MSQDQSQTTKKPRLPKKVEIDRSKLPPIKDDGDLNAGAASSVATAAHVQRGQKPPKRVFIYHSARKIDE